ncbi:MAG: DUF2125 domain-containing protein [Rhodospirillaceae bacterium]|nr:DUF2125 domain-containing protein [Rhodospirillaceae bacterium]
MIEASLPEREPAGIVWMKRGMIGFVGFAVLLGLYVGYWTLMARQLQNGLDGWIDARRAEGIEITIAHRTVTGFPGRLHMKLDDLSVVSRGAAREWHWQLPKLEAWAVPWKLGHITYVLAGVQQLRAGPEVYVIASDRLDGRVVLQGQGTGSIKLRAAGFSLERNNQREASARQLDLDLAWRARPGDGQFPLAIDLGIDGADLPPAWTTPFGRRLSTLRLAGHINGRMPGGELISVLQQWRDGGGTLELTRFAAELGPLNVQAEGTAALDRKLQPQGAFTVRAERYLETVQALVNARLMRSIDATAAKLVLTVIAKRPSGREPFVETPLTLQDQVLSAGDLRLVRLPRINWLRLDGLVLPGAGPGAGKEP